MAPGLAEMTLGPTLPRQRGIGVIAPFDFALDRELWRWVPDDVSLFLTRLPYVPVPVTVEMASALAKRKPLRRAARDLLTPEPLALAYACTSGSFIDGEKGQATLVRTMLDAGAPAAVTTSGALVSALRRLDARRVAIVTPYIDAVTERLVDFLGEHGVSTVSSIGMGLLNHIWRVSYAEVVQTVQAVDRDDADAIFISCTNVPTFDIIEPLERSLGKPVLTANQVTIWAALDEAGIEQHPTEQWLVNMSKPSAA